MKSTITPEPDLHTAAALLGSKGGRAGTGDSKRRSKKNIQKAVKARIAANKARKAVREANAAEEAPVCE